MFHYQHSVGDDGPEAGVGEAEQQPAQGYVPDTDAAPVTVYYSVTVLCCGVIYRPGHRGSDPRTARHTDAVYSQLLGQMIYRL